MITTFIFVVMLVLGIIIESKCSYDLNVIGAILSFLGLTGLSISLTVIIATHATSYKTIQQNKIEYDGLCKRYEIVKSEYEDVSKSDVIADITAWNKEVYNTEYWTENPWTNWFNPKSIADNLEYIPLE
jgi:hypothetical protein